MAINIGDAVSQKTLDKLNSKDNKPDTAAGFEDGLDFGDLFDDLDDGFGGSSSGGGIDSFGEDSFGGGNGGLNGNGNGGFGGNGGLAGDGFGGGFGSININRGGQQQAPQAPPKKDAFDMVSDFTIDSIKSSGVLAKEMMKSIKTKNFDDFGSIATDWAYTGVGVGVLGAILMVVAKVSGIPQIGDLGFTSIIAGIFTLGAGVGGLGLSALGILSSGEPTEKLSDMKDIEVETAGMTFDDDALTSCYEDLLDDFLGDDGSSSSGFGDSSGSDSFGGFGGFDSSEHSSSYSSFDDDDDEKDAFSNEERIANLMENAPRIDRKFLVNNLADFFPLNAKGFCDKETLEPGSSEYDNVRALVLQAIADAAKIDLSELEGDVISITSSMFCYVIVAERVRGLSKTDEIKREVESYFREDSEDVSVSATVTIEHGNYKIVLTKGATDIITIGDCLALPEVKEYFLNTKNALPFIAGIDQYGNPVLADGRHYATMMVAGKPRSGKSWYILGIVTPMMAFNTPEDVMFLFIDPKKSTLFYELACMPHVIGLHDDSNVIQLFQEIIYEEGERRKEILRQNKCDNIWDLRNRKKVKLPVLFVVIDEFMTLKANLESNGTYKEFEDLMNMLITQLPFVGINLMFIPHRAQGVVTKTTRAMIMFSAAVRADNEIIKETLDEKKWDRPLTKPGDTALKLSDTGVSKYVRGAAVTLEDETNSILIEDLARAWYKMGVDIPDMTHLKHCYARDEADIADTLGINTSDVTHVQYSTASKKEHEVQVDTSSRGMESHFNDDDGSDLFDSNGEFKWDDTEDVEVDTPNGNMDTEDDIEIDPDWRERVEQENSGSSDGDDGWLEDVSASKLWESEDW